MPLLQFLYISLPTIIFCLGWLAPWMSCAVLLSWIAVVARLRNDTSKQFGHYSRSLRISMAVLALITAVISGIGGLTAQDGDYLKHNAFFWDLTLFEWPLAYSHAGADSSPQILTTYLNYYLPAALVGKTCGLLVGQIFSLLWGALGIYLTFEVINSFVKKPNILYPVAFVLFGELAIVGWQVFLPGSEAFGIHHHYPSWMYFKSIRTDELHGMFWTLGSNLSFLATGPHHVLPGWMCVLLILREATIRRSLTYVGLLYALLPLTSAFLAIGMLPFLAMAYLINRKQAVCSFENLVCAPLLLFISAGFLSSNQARFEYGFVWNFASWDTILIFLSIFTILGWAPYALLLSKGLHDSSAPPIIPVLITSILAIVGFSLFRIGLYMDLPIKAYNPAWIGLQICSFIAISFASSRKEKLRAYILSATILVGSVGALSDIAYVAKNGLHLPTFPAPSAMHVNQIGPKNRADALFSKGNSFFWRHLARQPRYASVTDAFSS